MFTALATDKTTETATEVAYFMVADQDYVRLATYRGAGTHTPSIFSIAGNQDKRYCIDVNLYKQVTYNEEHHNTIQ